MPSNVVKNIYDLNKNYVEVTFSQKRPPLDFEFNELQKIQTGLRQQFNKAALLDGPSGDGFLVEGTGNANEIRIRSGLLVHNGYNLHLTEDMIISSLTTPVGSNRTDAVCILWRIREVDAGEDPAIIDAFNVGVETATRQKLDIEIEVYEGGFIPTPPLGYFQYKIAVLNRSVGVAVLDNTQISDYRVISGLNYITSGGKVLKVSGLQYSFEGASGLVGGSAFSLGNSVNSIGANETRYLYVTEDEALFLSASLPTPYHVPLAKITSDDTDITDIVDLRRFAPMAASASSNSQSILNVTALVAIDAYELVRVTGVNTVSLANASSEATVPAWAIALDDASIGQSLRILTTGVIENSAWSFIPGSQLYVSETAGGITSTAPVALGSVIQKIGVALTPTQIYFNPDLTYDVIGGVSSHAQNTDIGSTSESFTLRLGQGDIVSPSGFYVDPGTAPNVGIRYTGAFWEFSNDGSTWNKLGVLNQPFRYNTTGNGTDTVFNMPVGKTFINDGEHLLVFAGTTLMTPSTDYVETSTSQITFTVAPLDNQALSFVCFSV